jgi:hypothetical protein
MRRRLRLVPALLAVLAFATFAPSPSAGSPTPPDAPASVTCSFSNPSHAGWCKQNASIPKDGTAEQVCNGILRCLNDTRCNATYCSATTLRGGWKLEAVQVDGKK